MYIYWFNVYFYTSKSLKLSPYIHIYVFIEYLFKFSASNLQKLVVTTCIYYIFRFILHTNLQKIDIVWRYICMYVCVYVRM